MMVLTNEAFSEILRGLFAGTVFSLGEIIFGENAAIAFFCADENRLVCKISKSKGEDHFMEWVYGRFHSSPFPEYIKFDGHYQIKKVISKEEYDLIVYPYIPSSSAFELSDASARNLAKSLWNLHKVNNIGSSSILSSQIFSPQVIYSGQIICAAVEDRLLEDFYEQRTFLTGHSLLHGDLRLSNILSAGDRLIDLEDAIWGPPEYDFGRLVQSLFWETACPPSKVCDLLVCYEKLSGRRLNRLSVLCSAILRLSYRLSMDCVVTDHLRVPDFINRLKSLLP